MGCTIRYKVFYGKEEVASSSEAGEAFAVDEGHLIPALGHAVQHMKKGETSRLNIGPKYVHISTLSLSLSLSLWATKWLCPFGERN